MTILPVSARRRALRSSLSVARLHGWLILAVLLPCGCASAPPAATAPETVPSSVHSAPTLQEDREREAAGKLLAEALRLRSGGEYAKAIQQAQEALCRWQQVHDHSGEFEALFEIGSTYFAMPRREDAALWYGEALRTAVAAGDRTRSAKAWNALGSALSEIRPDEARGCFEVALAIWAESGEVGRQADVLYRLGFLLNSSGKIEEALAYYQRALPIAQPAGDLRLSSDILNGMGAAYAALGQSKEALDCYDRALKDARQSKNRGAEAAILTGLGALHRRRGEPQKALTTLLKALEINQESKDTVGETRVRNHLGPVYLDLGQPERALAEYTETLQVLRSSEGNGIWIANTLINIGQVDLAQGQFQEALDRCEEALKVSHEAGGARDAMALHYIGVARSRLNQVPEAVQSLDAALALRRQSDDRPGQASTLLELGKAWRKQGDLQRAGALMQEALQIANEVGSSFLQAQSRFGLARLARETGNLQEALSQIEQAIAILESMRSDLSDDRLRSSFFSSKRSFYDFWVDLLIQLDRQFPGQGYADRAFAASERGRARSLLDLLAEGRLDLTRGIDPDLKQKESDVLARMAQIQRQLGEELSKKASQPLVADALRARLDAVEEERQQIELRIRAEHPLYAQVRYPAPLRLEEIQRQLDRDSALLEYTLGEEGAYLFVVTPQRLAVHALSSPPEIAEEVQKIRAATEKPAVQTFSYLRTAHRLYQMLIDPARADLAGVHRLLIAPDGALHFLSFETLLSASPQGDRDLSYLLREFSVSYIPSASVLSWLSLPRSPAREQGKRFLAFVDPDYGPDVPAAQTRGVDLDLKWSAPGNGEGWRFPRLVGSDREVSAIASRYPPAEVQVYQHRDANEENVKNNDLVTTARRIHFATHGVLDEERPEFSGLALTRTDAPDDDGFLRVYEIFNLDLNAELVVLSACDSGLGREVTGEGLVGLTRAFLYAGAPSVVVSLWRVADAAAPDLMIRFYENLDRSGDKAEALRQAKLAMIRQGGKYSRPYYWAPFVLVGTPR